MAKRKPTEKLADAKAGLRELQDWLTSSNVFETDTAKIANCTQLVQQVLADMERE